MTLSDADVAFFPETMAGTVAAYHAIEAMADPMPPVKYPRTPGYRPEGADNKYNAWYYKSEVQGAPSGKLRGKRIALKDNVCLAGVPMMNGASSLEGYPRHRRHHRDAHARCGWDDPRQGALRVLLL